MPATSNIMTYLPFLLIGLSLLSMAKRACPSVVLGFLVALLVFVLMFGAAYTAIELYNMYDDSETNLPPTVVNHYSVLADTDSLVDRVELPADEWEPEWEPEWETEEEDVDEEAEGVDEEAEDVDEDTHDEDEEGLEQEIEEEDYDEDEDEDEDLSGEIF